MHAFRIQGPDTLKPGKQELLLYIVYNRSIEYIKKNPNE